MLKSCEAVLLAVIAGFGQEAQPRAIKFEVAAITVARDASNAPVSRGTNDDALLTIEGASLRMIIGRAYDVGSPQIVSRGLGFIDSSYFNISAKIPAGGAKDKVPEMLRNLLQERFGLVAHRENRVAKGYILTVANAELLKTKGANPEHLGLPSQDRDLRFILFQRNTMRSLARGLGQALWGTPILNDTKTEGTYTLWIQIPKDGLAGISGEVLDSLAGYGLKLQKGEFPVDYLVVEKVNKTPTEN